jgi:TonB-linked SusC/RagA family outer membrane protein
MQNSTNVFRRLTLMILSMMFSFSVVMAQERTVSGKVTASDEGSLPGVNIFIQGTTVGTISDLDGSYKLTVPGPDAVLIFSSVGYVTQSITVGSQTVIDLVLEADVTALQEIVVTGYTSQSKRNISGAVATVDPEELKEMPVSNIAEAMQGRAPGVEVRNSGEPGGGITLRIRGYGTINDNNPLYILDGTPISAGDMQAINPNDIESMQILKDASTASIYGARAANGVVIITTNKGTTNKKSSLSFDAYYGTQMVGKVPEVLNPQQLGDVLWEGQRNAGLTPSHPQYGTGASPVVPDWIIPSGATGNVDVSDYNYLSNSTAYAMANKSGTDWLDELFDPATIQSYNLTAQGGSEQGTYAVSAGYFSQDGIVMNTGYDRLSMRINSTFNISEKLRIGETFMFAHESRQSIGGGRNASGSSITNAVRMPQMIPVKDVGGNYSGTRASGFNNPSNPIAVQDIQQGDDINRFVRAISSIYGEYDIIEGLTIKTSFNANFGMTFQNSNFDQRNLWDSEPSGSNSLSEYRGNGLNWVWYNTINYRKTFAEAHNIGVLLGTEAINNDWNDLSGSRTNFFSNDVDYQVLRAGEGPQNNNGNKDQWALFSLFGKIDYDYNGKYILSATVRRDGSSRFGEANRYGVFPAFSAAWRLSDESFMQGVSAINDLKLRFGWGQTGNQNIGNYRYSSTFAPSIDWSAYSISGAQNSARVGFDSQVFGNPNVKWETTTTLDIGFDLTMANNRLGIEFDWYNRLTSDMLLVVPVSSLAGIAANPYRNVGEMKNTGVDLGISWRSNSSGDFNWTIGANLTMYKNEVIKLYNPEQQFDAGGYRQYSATRTEEGEELGYFYGYNILGVFMTQEEVNNHATQAGADVGRWKYEDVNGDGEFTAEDQKKIGSPHPDLIYGLPVTLKYKNWDMNIFFSGTVGNDLYNVLPYWTDYFAIFQNSNKGVNILDSWGYNGQNMTADARLPQMNQNQPAHETAESSYHVEDGSYLRLKQLTIGYNIPMVNVKSIDRFRVYFQAVNLFTITGYSGWDPEVGTSSGDGGNTYGGQADLSLGVDNSQYPVTRQLQLGVNITF